MGRAEQCEDKDVCFIFLWIAFNAACANEVYEQERSPEQKVFGRLLKKLVNLDEGDVLYKLIWAEFSGFIHVEERARRELPDRAVNVT